MLVNTINSAWELWFASFSTSDSEARHTLHLTHPKDTYMQTDAHKM